MLRHAPPTGSRCLRRNEPPEHPGIADFVIGQRNLSPGFTGFLANVRNKPLFRLNSKTQTPFIAPALYLKIVCTPDRAGGPVTAMFTCVWLEHVVDVPNLSSGVQLRMWGGSTPSFEEVFLVFKIRQRKFMRMTTMLLSSLVIAVFSSTVALSAERIQIEHLVAPSWGQLAFETYTQIAEIFNKKQDRIEVHVVMGTGNYEELVMTRLLGGAPPDVITSNKLADLAPKGILRSLTEFAERDDVIGDLLPPAVEQCTWDGELLMLPQVAQPFVTYYNPFLFAQSGIADPYTQFKAGGWDWEAVSASARKISRDIDNNGVLDIWGTGIPVNWQQRTILWVVQAGGKYFDRWVNPTKATYDSPEVVTALTFIKSMIETNAMPLEGALGSTGNRNFIAGKTGMVFEGTWQIGNNRNGGFYDWDLAPVAKGPANAGTIMQIDGLQMLQAAPHPEESWEWMKFLVTDPEAYALFTRATGRSPAVLRGLQTYLQVIVEDGKPVHVDAVANAMMNPIIGPCIPIVSNVSAMGNIFGTEIPKYLRNEQSLQVSLLKINEVAAQTIKAALGL